MARCSSCLTINRGPNTTVRHCSRCQHPLVFDAKADGFSDLRLVKAMNRLSVDGQLAYTETQLFYALSGRETVGPTLGQRFRRAPRRPKHNIPALDRGQFSADLDKWTSVGGEMKGRFIRSNLLASAPNRSPVGGVVPTEIAAHGFDRAVVVDSAEVAITLVANNFHIDNRCAVLSVDGYPEAFLGSLLELLNRNPNLVVAVAHGAQIESMDLPQRLRSWFPASSIRLLEVGMRPRQVMSSNLYATTPARPDGPDPVVLSLPSLVRLSEDEREWLAWGLSTSLESLAPQRLMRVLTQVFGQLAQSDEQRLSDGDHGVYDTDVADNNGGWAGIMFFDSGGDGSKSIDGLDKAADGSAFGDSGFDGAGFDGGDFDGDG